MTNDLTNELPDDEWCQCGGRIVDGACRGWVSDGPALYPCVMCSGWHKEDKLSKCAG